MEFSPKKNGNSVKLGSVEIAKTDPIRRMLIGFAPVFVGFLVIVGAVYLFSSNIVLFQNKNPYIYIATVVLLGYLLFVVSNTMFSSSRDMEGTIEVLLIILLIFVAAYLLGFRPSISILDKIFTGKFVSAIQESAVFLLVPIIMDLFILGIIKLFIGSRNRKF